MPRPKKTATKTKTVDVKSKKRHVNQSKKSRDAGAELHQTFTNSLSQLNEYWKKQVANTKKQTVSARAELKKAQDKLKAHKPAKVSSTAKKAQQSKKALQVSEKLQLSLNTAKENLVQAKRLQETAHLEAKKYAQLNKSVKEIEKDCRKQLAEAAAQAKQDAKKAKTKAKSAKPKKSDAEKAAPKTAKAKSIASKAPKKAVKVAAEQPKKRGRKPKTTPVEANLSTVDHAENDPNDIFEEQPSFSDMINNEGNMQVDFEDGSEDAFEAVSEMDDEVLDQ